MCRGEHNGASSRAWVTRGPLLQLRDTGACGGGEHIRHHNWRAEPRGTPVTPLDSRTLVELGSLWSILGGPKIANFPPKVSLNYPKS